MAYTIQSNKKNRSAQLHFTGANTTVVVAGNSSQSNIAHTTEVLTGASITQIYWGLDAGSIQVLRGGNLVITVNNSGHMNFAGSGMSLNKDKAANLVINFVGTANGFIMVELNKAGTFTSEYLMA